MKIRTADVQLGRVLHEDADYVTIQVYKNRQASIPLSDDVAQNVFRSLLFIRHDGANGFEVYIPWEDE